MMKNIKFGLLAIAVFALAGCVTTGTNGNASHYDGNQALSGQTVTEGIVESARAVQLDGNGGVIGTSVGAVGGAALGYKAGGAWGAVAGGVLGALAGNQVEKAVDTPKDAQELVVRVFPSKRMITVVQSNPVLQPGQEVFLLQTISRDSYGNKVIGQIRVVPRSSYKGAVSVTPVATEPLVVGARDDVARPPQGQVRQPHYGYPAM